MVAINRAIDSCKSTRLDPEDHFRGVTKMIDLGKITMRKIDDFVISAVGCSSIDQKGAIRNV